MKLGTREKLIVAAVVVVAVAAAMIGLLVVPRITSLADLDAQIGQADTDIESATTLLRQRQAIKQRSALTDAALMRLANELPETPELPSLIIELQDAVNESGLEFASLRPAQPAAGEGGPFESIAVGLMVRGEWHDMIDLLQRLPRMTRQVRVVSCAFSPYEEEDSEESGLVQSAIQLQVYTLPGSPAGQ